MNMSIADLLQQLITERDALIRQNERQKQEIIELEDEIAKLENLINTAE